ncbi:hypothetical protein WICMUC_003946 [Wickerhamomyces mucosus]|uniref:Importin N-terminal domain-containing protein n=1 Tax=Wickerhamomyces mucosus TaxID=1378264 RepID=A0A9P8TB19_9ASCO|nr:hypothetical protein WICMUC_003946 [Wickerhamomyces mucosus]
MSQPQIQEVVRLVETLYSTKDHYQVNQIQNQLQDLQKSQYGLQLGQELLSSKYGLNVQFFGALTYTIKLNTSYTKKLPKEDLNVILESLLVNLKEKLQQNKFQNVPNLFIIKKIFQNLSIIFNTFDNDWENPLLSLVHILGYKSLDNLDDYTKSMVLTLTDTLLGDNLKLQKDIPDSKVHQKIQNEIYPLALKIIQVNFQEMKNSSLVVRNIGAITTWYQYISYIERSTLIRYKTFNDDLLLYLIQCLNVFSSDSENTEDFFEIFTVSMTLLIEIFSENPSILKTSFKLQFEGLITNTEWCLDKIQYMIKAEEYDGLNNFPLLITNFLEINLVRFIELNFVEFSSFLSFLVQFTNIPLIPILKETISKSLSEFWIQVIELFNDEPEVIKIQLKGDEFATSRVMLNFNALIQQLSPIFLHKLQLSVMDESDYKDYENEFRSFRLDIAEFFDVIYSNIGIEFYQGLTQSIVNNNKDRNQMEVGLFILGSISTNFSNNVDLEISKIIQTMFDSNFFSRYVSNINGFSQSDEYIKSSIRFLSSINFFYKSSIGSNYLNTVIDYLLKCLKDYPNQQFIISRTLLEICDDCRSELGSSIEKFESLLIEMISNEEINNFTREKFINSVSFLIQSVDSPEIQENHVLSLIQLIENTLQSSLKGSHTSLTKEKFEYILSLLSSVHSVGRGLNLPDDLEETNPESYSQFYRYYLNTYKVQIRLMSLISIFDSTSDIAELNEKCLSIFKVGLLDDFGPFVFKTQDILKIASSKAANEKSWKNVLELINVLINSRINSKTDRINVETVSQILQFFILDKVKAIECDTDTLMLAINIFSTVINKNQIYIFYNSEQLSSIINITIHSMKLKEKFLIKSVSKFWVTFLQMKGVSSSQDSDIVRSYVYEIGHFLTLALFQALINSSRSDLDQYSNIIVVLISKFQLQFTQWATNALNTINQARVNSGENKLENREIFLKKLLLTRGLSKKCHTLIKDFWLNTNGLASYT